MFRIGIIAMAAAGCLCASAVAEDVAAVLKRCEEACSRLGRHAQFTLRRDANGWRVSGVETGYPDTTDPNLTELAKLPTIDDLRLAPGKFISSEGRHNLLTLRRLKRLHLGCSLTGDDLEATGKLPSLEDLQIDYGCVLTDEAFSHLGKLSSLRRLAILPSLGDRNVLGQVGSLTNLEELRLDWKVRDGNLPHMDGLTKLRKLSLSASGITAAGVRVLAGLPKLECLSLTDWRGESDLSPLHALKELAITLCEGKEKLPAELLPPRLDRLEISCSTESLARLPSLGRARSVRMSAGLDDGRDGLEFAKAMARFPQVTELDLQYISGCAEGLTKLKDVDSLRSLRLGMCVGGADEINLAMQLKRLESLTLDAQLLKVKAEEVSPLFCLRGLRYLELRGADANMVDAMAGIKSLQELRTFKLDSDWKRESCDVLLSHVKCLGKLEDLSLGGRMQFSDEGLKALAGHQTLQRLELLMCEGFSTKGLAALVESLPELRTLRLQFAVPPSGRGKAK